MLDFSISFALFMHAAISDSGMIDIIRIAVKSQKDKTSSSIKTEPV